MTQHRVVSREQWLAERNALLAEEKAFTRTRDNLTAKVRALPWVEIEDYRFAGRDGAVTLSELFRGRSQLIVYHLMFGPDAKVPCKSCSFWADNFERAVAHLRARDTNLIAVSRAAPKQISAIAERFGWTFEWVSCGPDGKFNRDFGTHLTKADLARPGNNYNYGTIRMGIEDTPGISIFAKDAGKLYHTYSAYSRGLDMFNGTYHYLDFVPKGRDEKGLRRAMEWVRFRDEYPQ